MNLSYFIPALVCPAFPWHVPLQNGAFHPWPATPGNLSSHCAEIYPLKVPPTDAYSTLWDATEHTEPFPSTATFYCENFKSTEKLKKQYNEHPYILIICSPIINIFPYLLFYLLLFFFFMNYLRVCCKHKPASPLICLHTSKNKDILPHNSFPTIHLNKVILIKYYLK